MRPEGMYRRDSTEVKGLWFRRSLLTGPLPPFSRNPSLEVKAYPCVPSFFETLACLGPTEGWPIGKGCRGVLSTLHSKQPTAVVSGS